MTKKIEILKNVLENLYIKENLSTHKIAKKFNCDPGVIQRRLREHKIKLREPKKKITILKDRLYNLYINKQFSTQKIAKMLGISSCTVYYKLKQSGIKTRAKKILKINKEKLKKLYVNDKLSCSEIAIKLGFDRITIFNKIKKLGIKTRGPFEANIKYSKKRFLGDNKLKAYMVGFRLGDLNVKAKKEDATIFIKSNTTKKDQLNLIKKVYGKYGHFKVSHRKKNYCIWCNLDKSFSFLLPKQDRIEDWILNNNNYFFPFLAGYIDAEGSFGIYQNRAKFRVGSYDKGILEQISNKLNSYGIKSNFNLERKAIKGKHNQDFYRVSINEKESLLKFIRLIKRHIKHKKRYRDMISAEKNILKRNKKHRIQIKSMKNNFFQISTAIDYPSARFHLGHAYEKICTDVFARWKRLQEFTVHFSTGTDCHGLKIQRAAEKQGKEPKQFVNEISSQFKELAKVLNISYDDFIMTTEKRHENSVINILTKLKNNGDIYKGQYGGPYCVDCETFYTEKDLVNGNCPIHKKKCEQLKETSYFFKLSKYQNKIIEIIKKSDLIWPEKKKNEVLNRLKEPLKDLSISRKKVKWGISLPFDKNMTVFVWVDALINYLTTIDYPNKKFTDFWPATHIIGPDIVWHHTAIWYSILLSLGLKLPRVVVHGFINLEGEKLSKARGITIDPIDLAEKYSVDSLRYFLMRNIPFGQDGDFSEKVLVERHNNELADKLGNLVSRVFALAEKYRIEKCENKLIKKLKLKEIENHFENYELDKALNLIFEFIDVCNEYVQENKLWETHDKKRLYELADSIKAIAILLWPFIPNSAEKIAEQLGFKIEKIGQINKPLDDKIKIKKGKILFKKIK